MKNKTITPCHAAVHLVACDLIASALCLLSKHRIQKGLRSFRTAGLLLFVCGWLLTAILPNAAAQSKAEKPVAVAGDEAFYEKDFLPQIQSQLNDLRKQEYELKRQALETAISKKLVRAEAKKRGVSEEELLRTEVDSKVAKPTQAERDQAMADRMLGTTLANAMGGQFDKDLQQDKLEQARQEYLERLWEQAGVKIYLLPATVEVGYDPARVRGNPDAKITMIEFSDFQCPFCLQAYSTVKSILKKYGGKVKLAYRDLPLLPIRPGTPGSAEASRCAGEQGKYWEYHDLLFENQDEIGEEAFSAHAESLKLDVERFQTCLQSGKFKPQIQEDFQEGIRLGIKGTPAFFINGVMVSGAQPQSEFEEIIEAELATMD